MVVFQRITIIRASGAAKGSVNEEIRWLGTALGLFTMRDKDSSCYRIFVELLKSSKVRKAISSDDVASHLSLSRGTVMHHMNRLIDSGIVVSEKGKYVLRVENLEFLIDELEKDIERAFKDIKDTAKKIDKEMGL